MKIRQEHFENSDAVKDYKPFDAPDGSWTGQLDSTLPWYFGIYCFFTAVEPEEFKGKKFRLIARAEDDCRPSEGGPKMETSSTGLYLLETAPPTEDHIFSTWTKAIKL